MQGVLYSLALRTHIKAKLFNIIPPQNAGKNMSRICLLRVAEKASKIVQDRLHFMLRFFEQVGDTSTNRANP